MPPRPSSARSSNWVRPGTAPDPDRGAAGESVVTSPLPLPSIDRSVEGCCTGSVRALPGSVGSPPFDSRSPALGIEYRFNQGPVRGEPGRIVLRVGPFAVALAQLQLGRQKLAQQDRLSGLGSPLR